MSIFEVRTNLKPYEYPELIAFKDAIRSAYWVHDEFESELISDVHDYKTVLTETERTIVARTMLAIAQIEVSVKEFWGDVYKHCPKPEIAAVGATFAESEVRHFDAYSELIELLGLNEEFIDMAEIGAIADRIKYLKKYTSGLQNATNQNYTKSILLFSLFVEHVSLFSQFLIMMAFNRHKGVLKGISNAVEATSKEEQIHGEFGVKLIAIIRKENPDWFDQPFFDSVLRWCRRAYAAECKILDWIFADGEVDFISRPQVETFLQDRFNRSLTNIGVKPMFHIDEDVLKQTEWFDEEIFSSAHVDFFYKRPTSYSKNNKSYSSKDLF